MKRLIILAIIVLMFGWTVYDLVIKEEETNEQGTDGFMVSGEPDGGDPEDLEVGLDIGSTAPDFELETLEGDTVKLSDFRGQRVMINFWATWCPPCRAEMPDMQRFYENTDIKILAIDLIETESSKDDVREFADNFELTFPILFDEGEEVSTLYHVLPVPTTYMVDSNGIIQYKAFGAMNYDMMIQEYEKMD
ncbi:peroxiredoxin family protein [Alkalibacillus haloalkaliphilus]|uniref:peroxiredoxin family protein n=1 Tax=Alkalibacillus haloalkaliphilus TaxID=94136 RepID=UPI000300ADB7|nr:redoxin domain-containing protein [Alkalibacillus haloalkaliphilus]